jgi:hypothetical protein
MGGAGGGGGSLWQLYALMRAARCVLLNHHFHQMEVYLTQVRTALGTYTPTERGT